MTRTHTKVSASCLPAQDPRTVSPGLDRSRYIPELDGLRALAIAAVFVHHAQLYWGSLFSNSLRAIAQNSWAGVDVFFVLSGFLITGILLRETPGARALGSFYIKRIFRIWPIYYILLIAACLASYFVRQDYPWVKCALFVQNFMPVWPQPTIFNQTWSLCVEEHFYLVWPMMVAILPRKCLAWTLAAVFFTSPILRWLALTATGNGKLVYTATEYRLDGIALGSLIAILIANRLLTKSRMVGIGSLLIAVCLPIFVILSARSGGDWGTRSPVLYSVIALRIRRTSVHNPEFQDTLAEYSVVIDSLTVCRKD
jgi:peptidoglycan/LPS O-acetylase OafA/YrhL